MPKGPTPNARTVARPHWTTFVRGQRRAPGTMNKTEAAYGAHLEDRESRGEVLWYRFEGLTFKLAPDCRYTPDFLVMLPDGLMECHECKGFWAEDEKIKIRLAADLFPFRFVAMKKQAKKRGGGWSREDF